MIAFSLYLVGLGLPELLGALVDPDGGRLHVGLDRVDHLALLVDHGGQVLEDGVHVDDVGLEEEKNISKLSPCSHSRFGLDNLISHLQLSDRPLPLLELFNVGLLLEEHLGLALPHLAPGLALLEANQVLAAGSGQS